MRGLFLAVATFVVLGAVAATAYQLGVTNAAGLPAGAAPVAGAYPYYYGHPFFWGFGFFGLLFPLFFLFVIFGIARAAFGGGHWRSDRRRMLEQWHHEMHEPGRSETRDR